MACPYVTLSDNAINKFNEFKTSNKIMTIMLNIRRLEEGDQLVFVKNFTEDIPEKDIINSLPDDEAIYVYRKIYLKEKGEKIICILYFPKNARAKKKMIYGMAYKEINIKLRDIFETITTDEPSDLYKENILKKLLKLN